MKKFLATGVLLSCATSAWAAPNVANVTQKGSLLFFPDIRAIGGLLHHTLVRISNDGSADVDVKCYWMDGFKNRVDFIVPLTKNQAIWFDARTGRGTTQVNPFPTGAANGFTASNQHPFLGFAGVVPSPGFGFYGQGLLACWAIDGTGQHQVKYNHLSGTATIYNTVTRTAFEYNAYAFFVPTGTDLSPVGAAPGTLNLNGLDYDACPLYQIGQFSPTRGPFNDGPLQPILDHLVVAGCSLNLNQDWTPVWTKLQFDVWNEEEVKFTGAYECADSWHETFLNPGTFSRPGAENAFLNGIDSAGQNFLFTTLATQAARYRVQGVKSTQCDRIKPTTGIGSDVAAVTTQAVGILAVQSATIGGAGISVDNIGTTLAGAGKSNGKIIWDPSGVVPEGGIR